MHDHDRNITAPAPGEDRTEIGHQLKLDKVAHDLEFLLVANDIHHAHYASTMAASIVETLTSICRDLKTDLPKVLLPDKLLSPTLQGTTREVPVKE